jgi:hypothetical protein
MDLIGVDEKLMTATVTDAKAAIDGVISLVNKASGVVDPAKIAGLLDRLNEAATGLSDISNKANKFLDLILADYQAGKLVITVGKSQ